jgi:hypothetical protein
MINEKRLTEPITEGGIPWINFFNGRLLSGEDLSKEQNSNLEGRRRLGRAIGEGVAYGLEVSALKDVDTRETPYVVVERGLAINRLGQTLWLENQTKVRLKRPVNGDLDDVAIAFDDCKPLQPGVYVADAGVYLLTIAPARKSEGRAAVSGLDNVVAHCNTHHTIEGVQFRLIQLGLNKEALSDTRLRNVIAYRCFGIDSVNPPVSFPIDPFGQVSPGRTLLDDLRPRLLTDCDVPLGIISWTSTEGIKFVDMWSVRRRVFAPSVAGRWEALIGEQRRSEGEAMFLQFQDHLESLRGGLSATAIKAIDHFKYLPPAGFLPIDGVPSRIGFNTTNFFAGITSRAPVFIEGAKVEPLFRQATAYPPIDLVSGKMFWLYWVRENMQEVQNKTFGQPQPYLIFACGHIPFQGEALYDVAHWHYSHYA